MNRTGFCVSISKTNAICVAILAVAAAFAVVAVQAQLNVQPAPEDFTRVYAYTYDDVFQSVQSALLGLHWDVKVDETNKDRGFVVATSKGIMLVPSTDKKAIKMAEKGHYQATREAPGLLTTRVHIEVVKPNQTRVTLGFHFRRDDTNEEVELTHNFAMLEPNRFHHYAMDTIRSIFGKLGFILSTLG
jgi:hypothetical protein